MSEYGARGYTCEKPSNIREYKLHIQKVVSEYDRHGIFGSLQKYNFEDMFNSFINESTSQNALEPILGGVDVLKNQSSSINQNTTDLIKNDSRFDGFRHFVENIITDVWKPSDIELAKEKQDYDQAPLDIQFLIKEFVKFFLPSDSKVGSNIMDNVLADIKEREIIIAWTWAAAQEGVHVYAYSDYAKTLDIYTDVYNNTDPLGKYPFVYLKLLWLDLWTNRYIPFRYRLLAVKCTEQIHFVSIFVYIYWIAQTFPTKFKGLVMSNNFIASEESTHGRLASFTNSFLIRKPTKHEAHAIIESSVEIEMMCIRNMREEIKKIVKENNMSSSIFLDSIKEQDLFTLVKFIANIACVEHGVDILYPDVNFIPQSLSWYHKISLDTKTNFFEARSVQYTKVRLFKNDIDSVFESNQTQDF
jgi:ribonucleotide reductase beta subunit family protein with ferritin-like domain